jgi:hypothetical protein
MFSLKKIVYFLLNRIVFSQDCELLVPADPLNTGLFVPWFVSTNVDSQILCTQLNPQTSVFVEATILDIDTGNFFVYYPLILDKNTLPAADITTPELPKNNIVVLHFGANGNSIILINPPQSANCVNGDGISTFGQFAYCNALNFFTIVNKLISTNLIKVPHLGLTIKGDICPTTRHFSVIDQDQSDNVLSSYIITTDFKIAQNTVFNINNLDVLTIVNNGSDNRLLDVFILNALLCESFKAPDLFDTTIMRSSLALNEISAKTNLVNTDQNVIALIPLNNPMTLNVDGTLNLLKLNDYRVGVNQPLLGTSTINNNELDYCNNFGKIAPEFFIKYGVEYTISSSPDATVGNNLLNFLAARFIRSWIILGCDNITGKQSPISIVTDISGVAISNNIFTLQPNTSPTINQNGIFINFSSRSNININIIFLIFLFLI